MTASFYKNRDRLQANIRRVNLTNFSEALKENAFTYLVVSLEPTAHADSSCFESDLRPVAAENYFEEASEFEVRLLGNDFKGIIYLIIDYVLLISLICEDTMASLVHSL